jgi:hypothetical protein
VPLKQNPIETDEKGRFKPRSGLIDLTGMKFNRLTAVSYVGQGSSGAKWLFKCDCGKEIITSSYPVRKGKTKSCGCWNEENKHNRYRIHGLTGTKIQSAWSHMKQRCFNPNCKEYEHYGGRGITVCDEWKNSVAEFAKWAYENGYEKNLTLDRIDNNGNYEPNNCRWVSMEVQENNKRNNRYYDIDSGSYTLSQIAKMYSVSRGSLYYWIHRKGMKTQDAIKMLVDRKTA